jgi:hypothetical protein
LAPRAGRFLKRADPYLGLIARFDGRKRLGQGAGPGIFRAGCATWRCATATMAPLLRDSRLVADVMTSSANPTSTCHSRTGGLTRSRS